MQITRFDAISLDALKKKLEDKQGILVWIDRKDPVTIKFIKEHSEKGTFSWCTCHYDARGDSNFAVIRCVKDLIYFIEKGLKAGDEFHWFPDMEFFIKWYQSLLTD